MPVDGLWPVLLVPLIAVAAFLLRAMSARGALAGSAIALPLTLGLGWAGFAMLSALLVVGTVTSSKSHRSRGAFQAFCNGGVAAICAIAAGFGCAWGGLGAAGALAAALSDTVAGEAGSRYGGRPRLLLFGRAVLPGRDGGMTPLGTGAGLLAAFPAPLLGMVLGGLPLWPAVFGGFVGNLVDSVLGATIQPRLGGRGNDLVNLMATTAGAGVALLSA